MLAAFHKPLLVLGRGVALRSRFLSSLPQHTVVGMPALSPTMVSGTIGKWTCKVGDKISPGDSLAEVETDKASVTFEAQDEFIVAKFLVEAGAEVKVGDPILVTVEEADAVSAFASFTVAAAPSAPKVESAPAAAPAPVAAAPPTPAPVAQPQPPKPVAAPTPAPAAAPAPAKPVKSEPKPTGTTFVYGASILKGVLVNKIAADQQAYNDKYGRSGHAAIQLPSSK